MLVTPEAVAVYRGSHSVSETAAHFGINERTVYKLVARARRAGDTGCLSVAPTPSHLEVGQDAPKFAPLDSKALEEVADGKTMWKCHKCNELMWPVPGTLRREWEKDGCYLHLAPAPAPVAVIPAPVAVTPAPALGQLGLQSASAPALPNEVLTPRAPARPAPAPIVVVKRYPVSSTTILNRTIGNWLFQSVHVWGPLLVGLLLCLITFRGW